MQSRQTISTLILVFGLSSSLSCRESIHRPALKKMDTDDIKKETKPDPSKPDSVNPIINDKPVELPQNLTFNVKGSLSPKRMWRLTYGQYAESVDTVLNRKTNIRSMFDAESIPSTGFGNESEMLKVGGTFASKLEFMVYSSVKDSLATIEGQLPCGKISELSDACLEDYIEDLASQAFRRPLSSDETKRYKALYTKLVDKKIPKADALSSVTEAILRSPFALFRSELGENGQLNDQKLNAFELAQALSYALTNSAPDAELRAKATDGSILNDEVYLAQAKRILASEGFIKGFTDYSLRWTGVEWLEKLSKNPEMFPEYNSKVSSAMIDELKAFVRTTVSKNSNFDYFLSSDHTTITPALAPIYNVPAFDGTYVIEKSEGQRSGILTLPGTIAMHSTETGTSPMHRALFLMGKLACTPPGDPPDNIIPSETPDPNAPIRDRFKQHVGTGGCKGCHITMDPYGFSLEHYDPIGRYRVKDGEHPVDASGSLSDAGGEFKDAVEMLDGLKKSKVIQKCFVSNAFQYVNGRSATAEDKDLISNALENFDKAKLDMSAVFLTLVNNESFKTRKQGK